MIEYHTSASSFASQVYRDDYLAAGSPPAKDWFDKLHWEKQFQVFMLLHSARKLKQNVEDTE